MYSFKMIEDLFKKLFLISTLLVYRGYADIEIEPAANVTSDKGNSTITLRMDENNHNFHDRAAIFKVGGVSSEPSVRFLTTPSINYQFQQESGKYIFYSNDYFDYEQPEQRSYRFNVYNEQYIKTIYLVINNIDDEPPTLTSPQCTLNENTVYNVQNSTCSCTLTDPDGWLNQTTFKILPGSSTKEPQIFDMGFRKTPPDNIYSSDVFLYLKDDGELDFEDIKFYLFHISLMDGGGNIPTNPETLAFINVGDMRDTKPEWTTMIGFEQFNEQEEKTFVVKARDGDVGLNKDINYRVISQDDEEAKYVSVNKENGTIHVSPIDRDKNDILTYNFEIAAYVAEEPDWETNNTITFYITDIDNNPPIIEYIIDRNNETIPFEKNSKKTMSISFLENYNGGLNTTIFIQDIDAGQNAQFTVELEKDEHSEYDHTVAFIVVPNIGLRNSSFLINVLNVTYLDYEKPGWKDIKFNVLTKGVLDKKKLDKMSVHIELIDYNDEIPQFPEDEYTITIKETAPKGQKIIQVCATDRDAEDKILDHTLVGSSHVLDILTIDSKTGIISVKSDKAFDYDTLNPVFVQVKATDKVGHSATVPLTINLEDVNNKAPTISSGDPISVEENQDKGIVLKSNITASDVDTTANLTVEINWQESYALKNSRRLDMTNDTIRNQVEFLDVDSPDRYSRKIQIDLIVNDATTHILAPDYELFDSLYLSLNVTDLNTDPAFLDQKSTLAIILIGIIDINDNTPIFDDDTFKTNRTVEEMAAKGTSVGSVKATDLDVTNTVTYNCTPQNPKYDWLIVDTLKGTFTVKDNQLIDADTDQLEYFNYTCTASDDNMTHTSEPVLVEFYILDRNNKIPNINEFEEIHLLEKPDDNHVVVKINTTDADRDIPFHTVVCRFSEQGNCNDKFYIIDNVVKVRNGKDIDRDNHEKNFTCSINCEDNQIRWRSEGVNSKSSNFTIIVDDKNDYIPELTTPNIVTSESKKQGDLIIMIIGKDMDDGKNADINFTLTSVINVDANSKNKDITSYFDLYIDESDYLINLTHKQAHLIAKDDLIGLYGKFNVNITLADRGETPNIQSYTKTLTIMKFNFASPRIISPVDSNFTLFSDQQPNSPLGKFRSPDNLEDFHASESSTENICGKWDLIFFVKEIGRNKTFFKFTKMNACTYQLQVNSDFNSTEVLEQKHYTLQITAQIITDDDPLWDKENTKQQPLNSMRNISITFADNIQKPYFDNLTFAFEVQEAKAPLSFDLTEKAHYDIEGEGLIPYYFLKTNNDTIKDIFNVSISSGDITVEKEVYYDLDKQFQFEILTADDNRGVNDLKNALLNVTVRVLPANYRPPKFIEEYFYGAVLPGFFDGAPIIQAEANDPDFIDRNNLTYSIEGNIEAFGTGLENIQNPAFGIEPTTGKIILKFTVDNTMSGYFLFNVVVNDQVDQFGNGPHNDTTTVTIFIISEDKTVDFRFYNNITEVQDNEKQLLDTMADVIGIKAYKQTFLNQSTDKDVLTVARLYFINTTDSLYRNMLHQDGTSVTAVDSNVIMRMVSNYGTYSRLQSELRNYKLMLVPFPASATKDDSQIQTWLIGTSAVLGALCIILLIIFVVKIRQLNKTISKLTSKKFGSQESGLNRLGLSAPTTNKHAIEGSNPIFNNDDMKKPKDIADFDTQSIRSGDSDLIGVENNPEFDLAFDQNDSKTTYL
nr:cadherin [Leptinotarsa decemlineata]